jgi:periplasmic protein TonB
VPVKPPEIVQPPEKRPIKKEFRRHDDEYKEEDNAKPATGKGAGKASIDGDDDGEEDGVAGGVKGGQAHGIIGGSIGGLGTAPAPPRQMPTQFGALQKISGDMPQLPPALNHGELGYVVEARICVDTTGAVESVALTKTSDRQLNELVTIKVRTWRFKPMKFNGMFVAFCYPARFEFNPCR